MLMEWALQHCARELRRAPSAIHCRQVKFLVPLGPGERADLWLQTSPGRASFRIERSTELLVTGILEWRD